MRAGLLRSHGGPGAIVVEDVPTPPLGDNQVLIKVKASSVNRLDALIREGNYPNLPQLPVVLGRDGAGVVEQVSPSVTTFHPGDRVFFVSSKNGANADHVLVDPNFVFPLPSRITFAQGATLGIAFFAAYRALFIKAYAQAGQTILVHGASGGVGLAACQLAKVHGLRVFGTVGSEEGEKLAKTVGHCEKTWNHNDGGYVDAIASEHPQGFDIILEMLANVNLSNDLRLLARNGRVVVVGNRGNIEINPDDAIAKEAAVIGLYTDDTNVEDYQRIAERLLGLLNGGHITPHVGRTYPLDQLPDAHNHLEAPGATGKIVLIHDQDAEELPSQAPAAAGGEPEVPAEPSAGEPAPEGGDLPAGDHVPGLANEGEGQPDIQPPVPEE